MLNIMLKMSLKYAAGDDKGSQDLILRAREITESNFICLVFANSEDHMKLVSKIEKYIVNS